MPVYAPATPELEIAHVLFMDIVGYSRLMIDQQTGTLNQFQEVVRGTCAFGRAEARLDLIRIPTGDGMALVFFRDMEAAVRCAVEVGQRLRSLPEIPLRMGLHSGPVYRVADINAAENVAGAGINMAQRVMDCGDAGHILVSSTLAENLRQLSAWSPLLHDLGTCEVKHGVRLHLYNLYRDDVGNPELPEKLRAPAAPVASAAALPTSPARGRVALVYRRHAQPDEHLLGVLEGGLREQGFDVFIDRHLTVGVEGRARSSGNCGR